jgi:hypothetical protein
MPLRISLESTAQRHDRIAELVTKHGEEAVLLPVGFLKRFREACEFVPLCDDLPPLTVEIEEDIGLGAQHVGFDRLLDEVYGARFIAAEAPGDVGAACGNEDDRDMTRTLVGAHDFGEFEPVHAGHLDVEQRECIVVDQHEFERLLAATRGVKVEAFALEKRTQRKQIFLKVVDQQEFDGIVR